MKVREDIVPFSESSGAWRIGVMAGEEDVSVCGAIWVGYISRKKNNFIHRSRNTFKLLLKSKIKVEINHFQKQAFFPFSKYILGSFFLCRPVSRRF